MSNGVDPAGLKPELKKINQSMGTTFWLTILLVVLTIAILIFTILIWIQN